jgi:hypothetical protein
MRRRFLTDIMQMWAGKKPKVFKGKSRLQAKAE